MLGFLIFLALMVLIFLGLVYLMVKFPPKSTNSYPDVYGTCLKCGQRCSAPNFVMVVTGDSNNSYIYRWLNPRNINHFLSQGHYCQLKIDSGNLNSYSSSARNGDYI